MVFYFISNIVNISNTSDIMCSEWYFRKLGLTCRQTGGLLEKETKHISQTGNFHIKIARRKGNSAFSSNLFAWQRTVKGDRMKPNCGELSEIVFLLKSNINQSCSFFSFMFFYRYYMLQINLIC